MSFINRHQLISYLRYYVKAKTVNSVHSPYVYRLLMECLENRKEYNVFAKIDLLRQLLAQENREFDIEDLGAGSRQFKTSKRTVSGILATSVLSKKEGNFLFNLARILTPKTGLELGTSLGLSALYLCLGARQLDLHTIEGDQSIHDIAVENFKHADVDAHAYCGAFDHVLPNILPTIAPLDVVYIDGNHSYEATLRYHQMLSPHLSKDAILIYDDIYWSSGMTKAWQELIVDPSFQYSIDLFNFGLLIKQERAIKKQHFTIIERIKKPLSLGFWG